MAADGELIFEISADNKKAKDAINDTTESLKKAGKQWEGTASKSTESIGKAFSSIFGKIGLAAAITKATKALAQFASESVAVASALIEVQNVVDVTFGEGASKIEEFASKAGRQFGLTELQAKQYASTLGAMMKSAGLAEDKIVDVSTDLAGLAADMASFYNIDFDTAFEKIRSGISGLTLPLKQLGINMNVANIEAFALSQGITKAYKNMTQGEQIMLRYQYLMKATSDAQGDFQRTSDSLANAQRRVTTAVESLKAAVGESLYETVANATTTVAEFLESLVPSDKTVLEQIAEIDLKKTAKLADIEKIRQEISDLLSAMEKLDTKSGLSPNSNALQFISTFTSNIGELETALDNGSDIPSKLTDITDNLNPEVKTDNVEKGASEIEGSITGLEDKIAKTQLPSDILTFVGELDPVIKHDNIDGGTAAIEGAIDKLDEKATTTPLPSDLTKLAGKLNPEVATDKITGGLGTIDSSITDLDATATSTPLPTDLESLAGKLNPAIEGDFADRILTINNSISTLDKTLKETTDVDGKISKIAQAVKKLPNDPGKGTLIASIAEGANELGLLAGAKWQTFIDALGGLAGKGDIPTNLNGVAEALAKKVGGNADDWKAILSAVGDNLGKATSAVNGDNGSTADFMEKAAAAADDLGQDYSELWTKLLVALGTNAGAAVNALKDATNVGSNLESIADGANKLTIGKEVIWGALLGTLQKLDGLDNIFSSTAAGNVEDLAKALSNNSPEVSQAQAWQIFLDALQTNPGALSELTGTNAEDTAKWLSTIADAANKIKPDEASAWSDLLGSFVSGLPGLNDTEYGASFFDALRTNFLSMGRESDVARAGLAALGYSTEDITTLQSEWLIMTQNLVKQLPELSSIVNTQTGEIKGGAQAVSDYIDEWGKAQEKQIMFENHAKKMQVLEERYADRYELKADMLVKQAKADRMKAEYEAKMATGDKKAAQAAMIDFMAAQSAAYKAEQKYNEYIQDYETVYEGLVFEHEVLVDTYGEEASAALDTAAATDTLTRAANEDSAAMTEVETAVKNAESAMKALADYQEKVRAETESTVRSVISGFKKIETPMQKARNDVNRLWDAYNGETNADKKKSLEEQWKTANAELETNQISIKSMTDNLQTQLDYMRDYSDMLTEARAKGVSEDLLAALSDGSQESFDYLEAITKYGGDIKALNKAYEDVQKEAEQFTNTLTDQKLTADEEFKTLVENVQEAVSGLDMGETTYTYMSNTLNGIISACGDKSEAIKSAVDGIVAQMQRLSNLGAGAWLNGMGRVIFKNTSYSAKTGSQANGLDYVPYDGYLALLHQGERIQTAAEADLARRYSYQQPSFDYDAMGGAIGANIGRGNVYLDGKTVGQVISDRQANSYRALERSGWQG